MYRYANVLILLVICIAPLNVLVNAGMKNWWAKRIPHSQYYVAGKLSIRDVKYAAETTFKTIVSLQRYSESDSKNLPPGEYFPSTEDAERIVDMFSDIHYHVVLEMQEEWLRDATVDKLDEILKTAATPVLFYADDPSHAAFLSLVYFVEKFQSCSKCNETADMPNITAHEILPTASKLGFNFNEPKFLDFIKRRTGTTVEKIAFPDLAIPEWYTKYWQAKPIVDNWYIAGGLVENALSSIKELGFKTILNFRNGVTKDGQPSQENVNLVNVAPSAIPDDAGRQSTERLLAARIDPAKPNTYISPTSIVNYESMNAEEFGDSIGYNETMERQAIQRIAPDIHYAHIVIARVNDFSLALWNNSKGHLLQAHCRGAVLAQCSSGYRANVMSILLLAYIHDHDTDWALKRSEDMGFVIASNPAVVAMYESVLGANREHINIEEYCQQISAAIRQTTFNSAIVLIGLLLNFLR